MEGAGEALSVSLKIIKVIYETAHLYKNLKYINRKYLNEICVLITLKDQIAKSKRMTNNESIDNYLISIATKLHKLKYKIENVSNLNRIKKIFYVRNINNLAEDIAETVNQMKFLLQVKQELDNSSRMDIANIISDDAAREFWETNFGSENLFIQTNLFFSAIRLNTKLVAAEIDFLKKIINDDNDKYISAFEFQEWLDFFGDFSVVMRRTIDSLIDPNTQEPYQWYHKNVAKNLVKTLLRDYLFIVRKHATQKGVFIVNFYYKGALCSLFLRNKENKYIIERPSELSPIESEIHLALGDIQSDNIKDIVYQLENILDPNKSNHSMDNWNRHREDFMDAEINSSPKKKNSGFEIPLLGTIRDVLPDTNRIFSAIQFWK